MYSTTQLSGAFVHIMYTLVAILLDAFNTLNIYESKNYLYYEKKIKEDVPYN